LEHENETKRMRKTMKGKKEERQIDKDVSVRRGATRSMRQRKAKIEKREALSTPKRWRDEASEKGSRPAGREGA